MREMLYDCLNFRREDISCDMVGLEPQWMSRKYDTSVDKKLDEDRFYIPGWLPDDQSGPETFFYSLPFLLGNGLPSQPVAVSELRPAL